MQRYHRTPATAASEESRCWDKKGLMGVGREVLSLRVKGTGACMCDSVHTAFGRVKSQGVPGQWLQCWRARRHSHATGAPWQPGACAAATAPAPPLPVLLPWPASGFTMSACRALHLLSCVACTGLDDFQGVLYRV